MPNLSESINGTGHIYNIENKFKRLLNTKFALSISSATMGLWAVHKALNITNSEVVSTAYTWGGTIAGAIDLNNSIIFADIDPISLTLNPDDVRKRITTKTKAIIAVDIYGNPCNSHELRSIADEFGLIFILDCSQSFGATYHGQQSGWLADAAIFSFGAGKDLSAGEGAIICTSNRDLYENLIRLSQHPNRQLRDLPDKEPSEFSLNLRIHPTAAKLINDHFSSSLHNIKERQQRVKELEEHLLTFLSIKPLSKVYKSSYSKYTVFDPGKIISSLLKENNELKKLNISLVDLPIKRPLYHHQCLKSGFVADNIKCKETENQIANRIGVKFKRYTFK